MTECEGVGETAPRLLDIAELERAGTVALTSANGKTGLEINQAKRQRKKSFTLNARLTSEFENQFLVSETEYCC